VGWTLRYEDMTQDSEGLREALCTVGNGYFATRGAALESGADGVHYPGTYVAGCFNQLQTVMADRTTENESLVNAPNWLVLTFAAKDGPWLGCDDVAVLEDRQELDLRRGVLTWQRRVRDSLGHITAITDRRFVHMGSAHVAAVTMMITPENWSGPLRIRSELELTPTFKPKTSAAEVRYDPAACPDPLYVLLPECGAYVALDAALYARICAAQVRL